MKRSIVFLNRLVLSGAVGLAGCTATSPGSDASGAADMAADMAAGGDGDAGAGGPWRLDTTRPLGTSTPSLTAQDHPLKPGASYGALRAPLPTNSFFQNLVLGSGDNRVFIAPYQVKALAQELSFGLAAPVVAAKSLTTPDQPALRFAAVEALGSRTIQRYDPLSVTLAWSGPNGASLSAPLAQGAPYVTVRSQGLTPRVLMASGVALLSVNGGAASGTVSGARFELRLNNGSTWVVYASAPLAFAASAAGLTATAPFDGTLRAALAPTSAAAAVLDAHAARIPVAGEIAAEVDSAGVATVRLGYQFEGPAGSPALLMALPHQQARLVGGTALGELTAVSSSGTLSAVRGEALTLRYPLPGIGFAAPRAIDPALRPALLAALVSDKDAAPAASVDDDPYFGGKQLARQARLLLIAEELEQKDVAAALRARLTPLVAKWLDGQNKNPLVYDRTYGGVVTRKGMADPAADFGQGYYNDHHFHYGYFIYAAAALARGDADFLRRYGDKVLWLVRDIANPSAADPAFPPFRVFDWYAGHSWAAGLFAFGDNRNQESTSEAVHAWYAVQLYGAASGDRDVENLGRLLLGMEIASAQTYWQVQSASAVYPAPLRDQHVIGVRWSTKADVTTFFGGDMAFVYGIQILPVTPVTEALLAPAWVRDAGPQLLSAAAATTDGWRGILHLGRALIDRDGALAQVMALSGFDDGNSRTNSLHFLATR